jgi:hypothetical protein
MNFEEIGIPICYEFLLNKNGEIDFMVSHRKIQTSILPPALNLPVDVALPLSTCIITSTSCACSFTPLKLPSLVV